MRPTRPWVLALVLAAAGGVTFVALTRFHSLLPPLSTGAPVSVAALGIADASIAYVTRARFAGRPGTKPILPITVARLAALGKASAYVGALLTGGYAGLLGRVSQLSSAVANHDFDVGWAGVAASILLAAAGYWLESVGRVKQPPPSGEQ